MPTQAREIVQGFIHLQLSLIHAARRELLCAAVSAVMGDARIGQEAQVIGAALLCTLCGGGQPLVITVDCSKVAPAGVFVELRAVVTRTGHRHRCQTLHSASPKADSLDQQVIQC